MKNKLAKVLAKAVGDGELTFAESCAVMMAFESVCHQLPSNKALQEHFGTFFIAVMLKGNAEEE